MTDFTPGPLRVVTIVPLGGTTEAAYVFEEGGSKSIAEFHNTENNEANARLFVAAAGMYAALLPFIDYDTVISAKHIKAAPGTAYVRADIADAMYAAEHKELQDDHRGLQAAASVLCGELSKSRMTRETVLCRRHLEALLVDYDPTPS